MSIVNSILNLVDLNTTKYSRKLRNMRRDTKNVTKGIADSFKSIGSAWKSVIAGLATGALASAVIGELKSTEKAVASFISATGSLTEARDQFEMLQQAARDTLQPFDSLKNAALELKKNGIQATSQELKTFSQIAYGTGQSLETVSKAFTATIQGKYKQLNALGITAKDAGDKLVLTYKGVTQEIDKNTKALSDYFTQLGQENEGVLDYLQSGVTGAFNHLENAWGDFYRAIGESGLGDLINQIVRDLASNLDDITKWINDNREPIKAFFATVTDGWKEVVETTKSCIKTVKDTVNDLWTSSGLAAATGTENMMNALSQFFNFARVGFLEVMKIAQNTWTALKGGFQAVGEGIGNWLAGGSFSSAYNHVLNQTADQIGKDTANFNGTINSYLSQIQKNIQELNDKDLGFGGPAASGSYRVWENQNNTPEGRSFGTPGKTGGGRSGGGRAAPRPEKDGWPEYYKGLTDIARNGFSDIEKLRAEHGDRIAELNRQFAASQSATDAELAAAKKIIDDDYFRQYKAKQEEARDFLRGLKNDEMLELDNEYRERLEKLKEFYDQGLMLEQEYQDGLADIRKDYDGKRKSAKKQIPKDVQEEIDGINDMAGGISNLSSALGELTQGMSESSAGYKALFALQKSFAVASATMNAFAAWMEALNTKPFIPAGLAAYANAVALTTGILGQLKSVTMHDKGGRIGAGQLGIVGEYGPEIVSGPVNVTSRKKTAALARDAVSGSGDVIVNLYEDRSKAGSVENSESDGDRIVNIFVSNIRKGGQAAQALENTYQLRRYGA